MNNQLSELLSDLLRRKSVRIIVVLLPTLLIIWAVVHTLLQPATLAARPLNLSLDSNIQSDGDTIKVYNGNSFYTIDTANSNAVKVVFTPEYRLPTIDTMSWAGEKGALLTFGSGIMHTPVYDYFTQHNLDTTSDEYYTWYLDFTTGKLSLVDEFNLESDTAYYSEKDNGFYYVPNIKYSEIEADRNTLRFYSLHTHQSSTVVDDFNTTVQSIKQCDQPNATVCIVGRKKGETYGKMYIFATSKDSKKLATVYTQQGEVYQTPLKNTYILLSDPEDFDGVGVLYKKITTFNIVTSEKHEYTGTMFDRSMSIGVKDDTLYLIDGENNEVVWLRSNIIPGDSQINSIASEESYNLGEGIIVVPRQDSRNILVASVAGDVYTLSTHNQETPVRAEATKSAEIVGECTTQYNGKPSITGSTYIIFVEDDDSFTTNLANIQQCLAKNPSVMVGYTYSYKGTSGINGRISTD